MLAPLLATWLATQEWSWDKVIADPPVTEYRIYWSPQRTAWCPARMVSIPATQCDMPACDDGRCCGDIAEPAEDAWFIITAVNSAGESDTEHGPVQETCP